MKISVDRTNKIIELTEDVNLHELFEELNSLFPGGIWREFTLKLPKSDKINIPIYVPNEIGTNPYTTPQPFTQPSPYNPLPFTQPYYYTTSSDEVDYSSDEPDYPDNDMIY